MRFNFAAPGSISRTTSVRVGRLVSMTPPPPWQHPWQITPRWDGVRQLWTSTCKAGFVNGDCPVYRTTVGSPSTPATWPNFGINPLSGEPFFSAWVFSGSAQANDVPKTTPIDIPLYAAPLIDLVWYNIGMDGDVSTPVPSFFAKLGVGKPTAAASVDDQGNITQSGNGAPAGNRLLRGCDVILHKPRVAINSQLTLEPGLLTGISNVTQTLGLSQIDPGDTLKVYAAAPWAPPSIGAGINPLTGDYTEPGYDELLIGTVFLLSAPNLPLGTAPDQSWQPFVRHGLFWNLNWAQPEFIPAPVVNTGLPLIVTGDPFAQLVINYEEAAINDAFANALNIIHAASLAGSWWTPTGGGSTSAFPPEQAAAVAAPSGNGLDKNGLLQAQRIATAKAIAAQKLDPDFPYHANGFNTALLT